MSEHIHRTDEGDGPCACGAKPPPHEKRRHMRRGLQTEPKQSVTMYDARARQSGEGS